MNAATSARRPAGRASSYDAVSARWPATAKCACMTGRLGYASAVSWLLFVMVFVVTMFNWKFGNRYTNE